MPKKRSKRYQEAAKLLEDRDYGLEEAVALIKKFPAPKFVSTVTLSCRLGVDPRKSDQMVRGSVSLPHGTGKHVRVIVFAQGEAAKAATTAGADEVGYEDLIKKVQDGFLDFDVAIATPDAMTEVRKIARVLGPRGLMPNPKTGTVTADPAKALAEAKAGKVDFKIDKNANVAVAIGKMSFSEDQLKENAQSLIESLLKSRPATAKGSYLKTVTISASMCPGVKLEPAIYASAI